MLHRANKLLARWFSWYLVPHNSPIQIMDDRKYQTIVDQLRELEPDEKFVDGTDAWICEHMKKIVNVGMIDFSRLSAVYVPRDARIIQNSWIE